MESAVLGRRADGMGCARLFLHGAIVAPKHVQLQTDDVWENLEEDESGEKQNGGNVKGCRGCKLFMYS